MEEQRQQPQSLSSSSMPLLSRLDHLDFIMKHLEGKRNLPLKNGGNGSCGIGYERQSMTLDSAVREASIKGSLFDRVASLEHRLFQLCLEMESNGSSSGTSSQTFGEMSSSQGSKIGFTRPSLPIFTTTTADAVANVNVNQETLNQLNKEEVESQPQISNFEIQATQGGMMKGNKKNQKVIKLEKSDSNKEEKPCKNNGKKKGSSFWPHLKLMGC